MSERLREHIVTVAGRLSDWRRATVRLSDALPLGPLRADAPTVARQDFNQFLFQEATPAFDFADGRIIWRIGLFVDHACARAYCPLLADLRDDAPVNFDEGRALLPEVRRWLLGLSVTSDRLWNSLCSVLPAIADLDPAFVKFALDPQTWRTLVLADRKVEKEEKEERLKFLDGYWFGHVLNNALLHVLGALASNRFLAIGDYLDHRHLRGSYTHLMPHYLFAVLFEKVAGTAPFGQRAA
jgi:hypothetical protein